MNAYTIDAAGRRSDGKPDERQFEVIDRRRWLLVADVSRGGRSAVWFKDKQTGRWYCAESWQRHNPHRPLTTEQAEYVEGLIQALPDREREPKPPSDDPTDRDVAIKRIRDALRARSGKSWSVTGGRGTAWGWITIQAPPARRVEFGYTSPQECVELAGLLGLDGPAHCQGVSIPAGSDYRREYVDRAEGREPSAIGRPYWD